MAELWPSPPRLLPSSVHRQRTCKSLPWLLASSSTTTYGHGALGTPVRRGVLAQPPAALRPMTEVGFTEGSFRACAQNPRKPTRLRVCTGGPRPTVMVAATQSGGALHPTGGAVMRSHFLCSACSSKAAVCSHRMTVLSTSYK